MSEDKQVIVKRFDAETGEIDERVYQNLQDEQITEIIENGKAVVEMTSTKGWKIIEDSLLTTIEQLKEKLVDVEAVEEIRRYQSVIRAYSNALGLVSSYIANGEQLAQLRNPQVG